MKQNVYWVAAIAVVYVIVKYFVPFGIFIVYPITIFVTIMHELGHSLFAVLTGGSVYAVQINPNGSGFARIAGGLTPLVLAGGYIGSVIFGNLLLLVGLLYPKITKFVAYFFIVVLVFTAIYWFNTFISSAIIIIFTLVLFFVSKWKNTALSLFFASIGIISVLYILEDYNGGPSSDLQMFATYLGNSSVVFWMYLWLFIALLITFFTIRHIVKRIF